MSAQRRYRGPVARLRRRHALPLLLALGLVLLLCMPGRAAAQSQDADAVFADATQEMASGNIDQAVALLLQLADRFPDSPLVDDALFLRGTLQEEKLSDPMAAALSYRRLVDQFPDSRSALAARRRLEALERALGADDRGAEPLANFNDILRRYPERKSARSLALAQELLVQYASWPELHRVQLWIADTYRREGKLPESLAHYRAVLASSAPAEAQLQARLGAAEIQIFRSEYRAARAHLEALESRELSGAEQQAVDELSALLRSHKSRSRLLRFSYLAFAAMLLALLLLLRKSVKSWRATLTALRKPPIEVLFMAPFAVLMTAMALTGHQEIGPAVALISFGGLIVAWFSGCALRASRPLHWPFALACGLCALVATASLCYLALYRSSLLDLIITTVRFGPE